jgi:hypothetical protein
VQVLELVLVKIKMLGTVKFGDNEEECKHNEQEQQRRPF